MSMHSTCPTVPESPNETELVLGRPPRYVSFACRLALLGGLIAIVGAGVQEPSLPDFEEKIIGYDRTEELVDPVALLNKQVEAGSVKFAFEDRLGYLNAVLKQFKVPVSSQTLVFSKTSCQAEFTSPKTPRALYFNDNVYVGFAQGDDMLDVIAIDPNKGPIFYVLEQRPDGKPLFKRASSCMGCHLSLKTQNVPGLMLRSNFTASDGRAMSQVNDFIGGHNSPLDQRWGGWFVTGTHAGDGHLGNMFVNERVPPTKLDLKKTSNITDLSPFMDTSKYPSPHSDTVALLVLDHANRMQNLLTRAQYETSFALHDRAAKNATASWSDQRVAIAGEVLVAYMLMRDEPPLHGEVRGTSSFASEFAKLGPFDTKGRSLREFDLHTRLFKYPCSYQIYSEAFDALPAEMKAFIWKRLEEVLGGKEQSGQYAGFAASDRQAVREILLDTKPEYRAWVEKNSLAGLGNAG